MAILPRSCRGRKVLKEEELDDLILILGVFSIVPIFPDPFHPEKHDGEFRRVIFWEWLPKELWELWSGIELALRKRIELLTHEIH